MDESLKFELAEKHLNMIWDMLKKTTSKENLAPIQKEQREWLAKRDDLAKKRQADSNGLLSLADSYAEETTRRAKFLQENYLLGGTVSKSPAVPPGTSTASTDITGEYRRYKRDHITIKKLGGNEYEVEAYAYDDLDRPGGWSHFKGTGIVVDGALVVTNQETVQDTEWERSPDGDWRKNKLVYKSTFSTARGSLKIYFYQHPDFQTAEEYLKKDLSKMTKFQVAIINGPEITGGGDNNRNYEFCNYGIADLIGIYTKK
jgi:Uncharacterized protein conserved in bacteria